MPQKTERFIWHAVDVESLLDSKLGKDWDEQIINFALSHVRFHTYRPVHPTSREEDTSERSAAAAISGLEIEESLSFLKELYEDEFLKFAEKATNKQLVTAKNKIYGVNLNVQFGTNMHYECHVDSNPVQGMLYVTSHKPGEGGELVVANQTNARSIAEVENDCVRIYPKRGLLVYFDARQHSHYVPALSSSHAVRVAAAMNFYCEESPESQRPSGLTEHLGIQAKN